MATGDKTEIGRINELIASADILATPLTKKIARFSLILLWAILGLACVTFAVGIVRGEPWLAMFIAAVALAVGAIPEGLPATGLTFLGLQGMLDPPRPGAVEAVRVCQTAGIRVKMITGDHAGTASAIARKIGLDGTDGTDAGQTAITGKTIAELSDAELIEAVEHTAVFARVAPEQRLRLGEALQVKGNIVAMTGDGVNDAPALRQANIGIAMGITGTEVSKEAADMVLSDDNFVSIAAACEEGRGVFDNLTKFIVWTLPTNIGEGLVILSAIFAGVALPILTQRLIGRILLVGVLLLVGSFGLFEWKLTVSASVTKARTVAVNVFVMVELFYLFNCRSLTESMFRLGFFQIRPCLVVWPSG